MQRTDMEVIEHQAQVSKLTRMQNYKLQKARELSNKAEKMGRQGIAAASFHALRAKDLFQEADNIAKRIAAVEHDFNNPDFWTRLRRFFDVFKQIHVL